MLTRLTIRLGFATLLSLITANAYAWIFFFPIPNLAKPGPLQQIIDALEKSTETRALAFVSEDKTFGSKYWVWGQHTGSITQEEANRTAIAKCEASLRNVKSQAAGGQPLYDFGNKQCELHPFEPNEGPKIAEARKKAAEEEAQKLAAIEEAKRIAAAEEVKRIAAAEEARRIAAEEEAKRIAAAEEAKRQEELKLQEDAKRQAEARQQEETRQQQEARRKPSKAGNIKVASVRPPTAGAIDFNAEARKSARILGCLTSEPKVTGVDGKNIIFSVACDGGGSMNLSCDPSGLCLKK